MTIALLTDGLFPFTLGGIQKHSYYLAKYWAKQGLQVHVYLPNQYKEADLEQHFTKEELQNISFIHVPHPSSIRFFGHYIYNSYRYSKRLYQAIGQKPYDGIYAQGFTGWYFLKKEPFNERVVTNLHGLNMFQKSVNLKHKLQLALMRIPAKPIIKRAFKQISLGGKLTDLLYQQGAKSGSVCEVPNAISPEWLKQSVSVERPDSIAVEDETDEIIYNTGSSCSEKNETKSDRHSVGDKLAHISDKAERSGDAFMFKNIRHFDYISTPLRQAHGTALDDQSQCKRFIFIGRYERLKGIEEINTVLKQLMDEDQPFECHFIGPIPNKKKVQGQRYRVKGKPPLKPQTLNPKPNDTSETPNPKPYNQDRKPYNLYPITYWGTITDQQTIRQLLNDSDILLCPSYSEGMPTVILEAMASNCAIIATDVGASGELVNQENGWLIEGDIVSGLKKAMKEAIDIDDERLNKMKTISFKRVQEKYNWNTVAKQSLDVFKS